MAYSRLNIAQKSNMRMYLSENMGGVKNLSLKDKILLDSIANDGALYKLYGFAHRFIG